MQQFIKSFRYAFSGIVYAFKTQFNFKFHSFAFIAAALAGWYFKLGVNEWLWIIAVSGIVLITELLNTAIEVLVDMVSPEIHPKAKIVKDVAAAAVLAAAVLAIAVGLLIFIPKIWIYAA